MDIFTVLLLSASLAMDAFAVSLTSGLKLKTPTLKSASFIGGIFGFFQFFMPVLGYFIASFFIDSVFTDNIDTVAKIISFAILAYIGGNMLRESFKKGEDGAEEEDFQLTLKYLIPLAIATSIDAMTVGVTFAMLGVPYLSPCISIGIITFLLSTAGVFIGSKLGEKYKSVAEKLGGVVLILIAFKILLF